MVGLRDRRARRFYWLSKLIRSGKPAPDRTRGSVVPKAEAEVTEVAGQRKLLQWTIPGLAHFFTMWGFTILLLTIVEAYGALFQKNFHFPGIGQWDWVGFVEDFFAVMVLVALVVFAIIRIKNAPARKERQSRFYGSHTGAAWAVLAMIAGVIITLLLYRAAQVNTVDPDQFPYGWGAFASHGIAKLLHPLGPGVNSDLATVFLILNVAVISGFMVFVSYSKHLHIFMAPINVAFSRRPRALGALNKTPDMDMENVDEDTVFGVGEVGHFSWKQMLDFATCTECGRCQSACPAWNTEKPLSPKLLIMGLRDNMFASATPLMGGEGEHDGPGAQRDRPRRAVGLHHLRGLRGGVPGGHRAHRRHRRHAALPGAHGVRVPLRGRLDAAQRGEPGRPLGPGPGQADRVDPEPRTSRSRSSPGPSPTTSSTSTGSAAPGRSTSGPARASRPRPACCTGPGSPSGSSGPRSPAPGTRCAGWATSTSTRSRAA